jgi:hypothetical protein
MGNKFVPVRAEENRPDGTAWGTLGAVRGGG